MSDKSKKDWSAVSLKGISDEAVDFFKTLYADDPEANPRPMMWAVKANGELILATLMWTGSAAEKDAFCAHAKKMFKQENVVKYCFVMEAWAVMPDSMAEYEEMKAAGITPSQSDKRIEILTTNCCDIDGNQYMRVMELIRDPKTAQVVEFKERDCMEGQGVMSGRFARLLQ